MSDMPEFPDGADALVTSPDLSAPVHSSAGRIVVRLLLAAVLGVTLAALGTATHRTLWHDLPLGLVLALALTASMGVLCRAWAGLGALGAGAAGWIVAVQLLSMPGRGGDVLVTGPSAALPLAWAGLVWTYGGVVLLGVVAFLPRRWFARR